MAELLRVDVDEWKTQLPQFREYLAKFDNLPAELPPSWTHSKPLPEHDCDRSRGPLSKRGKDAGATWRTSDRARSIAPPSGSSREGRATRPLLRAGVTPRRAR